MLGDIKASIPSSGKVSAQQYQEMMEIQASINIIKQQS